MNHVVFAVTMCTALGSALVAGAFFVFSAMVMPALRRVDPATGITTMQAINLVAVRAAFMLAFAGTALAAAALIVVALVDRDGASAGWLIAGGGCYLLVPVGLTGGYHVPRNDALAALDPAAPEAAAHWRRYLTGWTRWNHLRALGALAATAAYLAALTTS